MPLIKALVTGASGQDGFYLIDLLHRQGCIVHAQSRRLPHPGLHRDETYWHVGDPADRDFLDSLISSVMPDEIYNLAAVSRPILSWGSPRETAEVNGFVPQEICELLLKHKPGCRLFQASSSEILETEPTVSKMNKRPVYRNLHMAPPNFMLTALLAHIGRSTVCMLQQELCSIMKARGVRFRSSRKK